MTEQITPYKPTYPGEVLLDELKARGVRQQDFAAGVGMQLGMLNGVVKGTHSVTNDIALMLEKGLDIPADFWMRLQRQYEGDSARKDTLKTLADESGNARKTIRDC